MPPERIALVSDVHGNLTAYRAVLADIAARGLTRVVNLGDVVGKGPRGAACVALTRERCEATIRGNWETYVAGPGPARDDAIRWWREELADGDAAWLRALPGHVDLVLAGRRVRLVHASAIDEFTRVPRSRARELAASHFFAATPFTGPGPRPDLVAYGDIHDAFVLPTPEGTLVNVGSAGNPLDQPLPTYVVLEEAPEGDGPPVRARIVRVPYDVDEEVAVSRERGMPRADPWEIELRTGIHRGRHPHLGLGPG